MTPEARDELERSVMTHCRAGAFDAATAAALRGYGPEIASFLLAFHGTETDADEVFSVFAERLWRGLPRFGWESSLRTWAYAIARNASLTHRAATRKRGQRFAALPEGSEIAEIAAQVRSATRSFLATRARDGMARLRDSLDEPDRVLLTLRIERGLSWVELARVLRDGEGPVTEAELDRAAAQLRKRFQRLKQKILEMGIREGLVKERGR
jgi:RNA polymerase sigma-70 factor (ECF subfamily)